ncbi:Exo-beta-D-glucosaminidase precursor [mine drainage metagenome]|uniref:Exo-beta-D-glucosaminidase n=1 Tax=mine drainage metagenome TaxID=410659 RepID=A0A1J5TMJ3_9ZZZZ
MTRLLRFLAMSALVSCLIGAPAMRAGAIRLCSPRDGAVVSNNTPSLGWTPVAAGSIEIWIDGARVTTLAGDATRYVPFPLSFGAHHWKVISVSGANRVSSEVSTFTVSDRPLADLPPDALLLRRSWFVQSSITAGMDGARLSSPGVDDRGWAETSLPATVLTALVRNGVYPNPYVGLNATRIPDACDAFNRARDLLRYSHIPGQNPWERPYWFRTTFSLPANYVGKRVWLTFDEINYRADVWLNGVQIAGQSTMVGMERQFRFDVTSAVRATGENVLAVAIHPLDNPGEPSAPAITPLGDPGQNMGTDAKISVNYAKWDTVGWDWQPSVPDRDMGITRDVYLSATDDLLITHPYVGSDLDPSDLSKAELRISFTLVNVSSRTEDGSVRATISDERGRSFQVTQAFRVPARGRTRIVWTPADLPALTVHDPQLWWPAGLGAHPLYSLRLEATTASGACARASVRFGIRRVDTQIDPITHSRIFRINGRRVFLRGGNWVDDMMLNWTAARYRDEIDLARHARLNFLRVWGPTGVPPDAFFDEADRQGVLIQQDFLSDNWGTFHNAPGNAPPLEIAKAATSAIIRKLRNHPSLIIWCGGNEGPNPREALIRDSLLPTLDPWGGRFYLRASNDDGFMGGGPYQNLPPEAYFGHPKLIGLNSEVGPSGVPEWQSLRQFVDLPPKSWAAGRFPLDGEWAFHNATDRPSPDTRKFSDFDDILRRRYGAPAGSDLAAVRGYVERAQMLDYETYRAVAESLNRTRWTRSTGFALWKYNSSWPSLVWQIVDWYQDCNAGFYAMRKAGEPVHVQFDPNDRTLAIVNRTDHPVQDAVLEAELFDSSMRRIWRRDAAIAAPPDATTVSDWSVPNRPGITFLRIFLRDSRGGAIADNLYWLSPDNDFAALATMTGARLVSHFEEPPVPGRPAHVVIENRGTGPALLVRVRLVDRDSGNEVLPAYWSDNDVSLLPGESARLTVSVAPGSFPGHPALEISGYNVRRAVD